MTTDQERIKALMGGAAPKASAPQGAAPAPKKDEKAPARRSLTIPHWEANKSHWILSPEAELKHISISGGTGSGKSLLMKSLLRDAIARGDSAVVFDHGGEMSRKFYDATLRHYILNPYDQRSVRWQPTNEITRHSDYAAISNALIQPPKEGESASWYGRGATATKHSIQSLMRKADEAEAAGQPEVAAYYASTEALLYYLCEAPMHGIEDERSLQWLLKDTPSAALFSEDPVALNSIRPIIADRLSALESLAYRDNDPRSEPFSITEWVRSTVEIGEDGEKPEGSVLFLTYTDNQLEELQSLYNILLTSAIQAGLELPAIDDPEAPHPIGAHFRLWIYTDELASLGYMRALKALLEKGRKHGLCSVSGYQTVAQLEDLYTEKVMRDLLSNYHTQIYLKTNDYSSAEMASRFMGETWRAEKSISESMQTNGQNSTGVSTSQHLRHRLIPNDFMELPSLYGYARIEGEMGVCRIKAPIIQYPTVAPSFEIDPATLLSRPPVMKKRQAAKK